MRAREASRLCLGFWFGQLDRWRFFMRLETRGGEAGLEVPWSPPEAELKSEVLFGK